MNWLRSVLLLGCALSTACSVLFELEEKQCSTDGDCTERGEAFANSVCHEGFCRAPTQASGCAANADCIGPQLCIQQTCTTIKNSACPAILGEEHLRSESPVVFSIFSPINELAATDSLDIQNYMLALEEWEQELPGGPGGKHPFVGLICDSRKSALALPHVIETVGVRAIIAGLSTDDLVAGFESLGREHGVFFLSPYDADSTLTAIDDDSLIWHMLGSSTDLAPIYGPLMARIEAHLSLSEPIRVAIVENEEIFEVDLAEAVSATMTISGTVANAYSGFSRHAISPADSAKTNAVMAKLLTEIRPHVIISAAGEEFVASVLTPLELGWKNDPPPFYVLSIENRFSTELLNRIQFDPSLRTRVLGVNHASAKDPTLQTAYLQRFKKAFPYAVDYVGYENFYDAMYYLLYAFVGAGNVATYGGADVARGFKRLLSGLRVDVEPLKIANGTAALQNPNATIELHGVMGPPSFDPGSGARHSEASVWCVNANVQYADDVLRLDETKSKLEGEFPCFAF